MYKKVASYNFLLEDTSENIEKFLENKNIIVHAMFERKSVLLQSYTYYVVCTMKMNIESVKRYKSIFYKETLPLKLDYNFIKTCVSND